jgi:hypothetical protein
MIAVDTLIHNYLHRTGTLRRFGAEHRYGPACYGPSGCAEILEGLARRIDAREFCPEGPACFPRYVQFAIWRFCAAGELDVCNGKRIDDWHTCENAHCPASNDSDRVVLRSAAASAQGRTRMPRVSAAIRLASYFRISTN